MYDVWSSRLSEYGTSLSQYTSRTGGMPPIDLTTIEKKLKYTKTIRSEQGETKGQHEMIIPTTSPREEGEVIDEKQQKQGSEIVASTAPVLPTHLSHLYHGKDVFLNMPQYLKQSLLCLMDVACDDDHNVVIVFM